MTAGAFRRNAWFLGASATGAQVLDVAVTPVVTRLYSPTYYGPYGVFLGALMIVSVFATLRYERRLMLLRAGREETALVLGVGCLAVTVGLLTVVSGAVLEAVGIIRHGRLWGALLGSGVVVTGANMLLEFAALRRRAFVIVAVARMTGAAVLTGLKLLPLLGVPPTGALLPATSVFSLTVSASILAAVAWDGRWFARSGVTTGRTVRAALRRGWDLAGSMTVSSVLNTASGHAPVMITSAVLAPAHAGVLFLAHRVLAKPMGILINAVADTSFPEFAATARSSLATLYGERRRTVFLISVGPMLFVAVAAPWLFGVVFGAEWVQSGVVARALAPGLLVQVVFTPFSNLFVVLGGQGTYMKWALLRFVAVCAGMLIGHAITGGVVGMAVGYSIAIGISFLYQHVLVSKLLEVNR